MSDSVTRLQEVAKSVGVAFPEERLADIAAALEKALADIDSTRPAQNPMPQPEGFDASWDVKR